MCASFLQRLRRSEVDERTELDDATVLGVLNKMVKQRRDSITQFRDGGRDDLADTEHNEIAVIENYLPEQMSDDELNAMIDAAITETGAESIRDMGQVMGVIKSNAEGRADMAAVGAKVKTILGQN